MRNDDIDPDRLIEHAQFIRSVVRGLVTDETQVDDVVQQTWLTAIESPPSSAQSTRGWLVCVAMNWARKLRRGDVRRAWRERGRGENEETPLPGMSLDQRCLIRRVTQAIHALDEPYRSMILMRYYEEIGTTEIAERLGISYATARTRLKRATRRLRAVLDDLNEEGRSGWIAVAGTFSGQEDFEPLQLRAARRGFSVESDGSPDREKTAVLHVAKIAVAVGFVVTSIWWIFSEEERGTFNHDHFPGSAQTLEVISSQGPDREDSIMGRPRIEPIPEVDVAEETSPPEKIDLRIRAVWEADGSPANGVRLLARPAQWNTVRGYTMSIWGTDLQHVTDKNGQVVIRDIEEGDWEIVVGRSKPLPWIRIGPDHKDDVLVRIPRGGSVHGRVVDSNHRVVPGAEIRFSREPFDAGFVIATADTVGEFRIRGISVPCLISARAPNFAPSLLSLANVVGGKDLQVELSVKVGGDVSGKVVDTQGDPIANAEVSLMASETMPMTASSFGEMISKGSMPPSIDSTFTDHQGEFDLRGVDPGDNILVVRHEGYAVFRRVLTVEPEISSYTRIALTRGCVLKGRVTSTDGRGIEGVEVIVRAGGVWADRFSVREMTDVDGFYRVVPAPTGRFRAEILGRKADLEGLDGRTVPWSIEVADVEILEGRLVDSLGEPLFGWRVDVETGKSLPLIGGFPVALGDFTSADGSFRIAGCPERGFRTVVRSPSDLPIDSRIPVLIEEGHTTTVGAIRITIPDKRMPTAWIRGRLVRGDGDPPMMGCYVVLVDPLMAGASLFVPVDDDGTFLAGPIPPGGYGVSVNLGRTLACSLWGEFQVSPHQTLDIGAFADSVPGGIIASPRQRCEDGCALRISVRAPSGDSKLYLPPKVGNHSANVPAGKYFLFVEGEGVAAQMIKVEVEVGQVTRVEYECLPGVRQKFIIVEPEGYAPSSMFQMRIEDAFGDFVVNDFHRVHDRRRTSCSAWLASGAYWIHILTNTGVSTRVRFDVDEGAEGDPICVELKRPPPSHFSTDGERVGPERRGRSTGSGS